MIRLGQEMACRLIGAVAILCQQTFFTLKERRERCGSLTTDDRSVHLNACPNNGGGKRVVRKFISEYFDQVS